MKVYAVTFADHKCYEGQKKIEKCFLEKCNIDEVISWKWENYKKTDYYINNKALYDSHPRGLGYWSWKPCIIYETMQTISDGDYILYHDSGRNCYNYDPSYDVRPFIRYIDTHCNGLGVFFGRYQHNELTKRDCFVLMNCDDKKYHGHKQVVATWHFWKKNDFCMRILKDWMYWCFHPSRIISNDASKEPNLPQFRGHRHDQSILTNLVLKEFFNKNLPFLFFNRGQYRGWEKNINSVLKYHYEQDGKKIKKSNNINDNNHTIQNVESMDLVIIIPVRNRDKQLNEYIERMNPIFEEQKVIPHYIIVYQQDDEPFNKGMLSNYGFLYALHHYEYKNMLFNDVDVYPRNKDIIDYNFHFDEHTVYHRYGFSHILSNFFLLHRDVFQYVNGYSNLYKGWGYEDCDLNSRCKLKGIKIDRNGFTHRTFNSNPKYYDTWLKHEQRRNAISARHTTKPRFNSIWNTGKTETDLYHIIDHDGVSSLSIDNIVSVKKEEGVCDIVRLYIDTSSICKK